MAFFNLLGAQPQVTRDLNARRVNKAANREIACQFGREYFDGSREQGYGGYRYDGRWQRVAQTAREHYGLDETHRVLDIGCAKGFFVYDLMNEIPGLEAYGVDVSEYALSQAPEAIHMNLFKASATRLPFPSDYFDAVFAINTLHNLERAECIVALKEINRVCKFPHQCFVQVDAYHNLEEKQLFEDWMLTAKTYCTPDEWLALFKEAAYLGDYFWTTFNFAEQSS